MKIDEKNHSPIENHAMIVCMELMTAGIKSVLFESKTLTLTVTAEPKTDDLGVELAVTPKAGTTQARVLKAHGDRLSQASSRIKEDAAMALLFNFALPDDTLPRFGKLVDTFLAEQVEKAAADLKEFTKSLTTALAPTLKAGDIDFAMVLSVPDVKGQTHITWAMKVQQGRAIESSFEQLIPAIPKTLAKVTKNVRREADITWHKWDILQDGDKIAKIAGSSTGWAAVRNDLIVIGVGKEENFQAALARDPRPAPLLWFEFSALAASQIEMISANEEERKKTAAIVKEIFGGDPSPKQDKLVFSVETGPELKVRLASKGATIRLFSRTVGK
jgi:hypothetical protein